MMSDVLYVLIRALIMLCNVYIYLIFGAAILSWFVTPFNKILVFLRSVTAPVIVPCQRLLQKVIKVGMPLDISPLVAYLLLRIVILLLNRLLILVI